MLSSLIGDLVNSSISSVSRPRQEYFGEQEASRPSATTMLIVSLITFVLILIFLAFVGKLLWNFALAGEDGTGLVSVFKKADSVWQILALYILLGLLFGR